VPQVRVRSLDANLGPSRYREFTRLTTKAEVIGYVQKKRAGALQLPRDHALS
jgi:hypothetical protein